MSDASLALQTAIRQRLIATPAVLADVAAERIIVFGRPEAFPSISIGTGDTFFADFGILETVTDIHVWTDDGLERAKRITDAVRRAILAAPITLAGHRFVSVRVASVRYLRDPSPSVGHAVLTVEAIAQEVAA